MPIQITKGTEVETHITSIITNTTPTFMTNMTSIPLIGIHTMKRSIRDSNRENGIGVTT